MPRKFIAGLVIGSLCTVGAVYYQVKKSPYIHPKLNISTEAKWTTVDEIEQSLAGQPPINVGFDIDDTVLFPNTSFHIAYKKFCPHDDSPNHDDCVKQQKFWDYMNTNGELSTPKEVGKLLIEMHQRRGDTIYFITAREKSKYQPETLTKTLQNTFKIKNMQSVIYLGMKTIDTNKPGKTPAIKNHNIKIFYGDSDADIAAAKAANIRGIRVLRAPNSQDTHIMPQNGIYGEEVIIGSDV